MSDAGALVPVKDLPNLDAFTFSVDGPELTVRLDDPLSNSNFDISGATRGIL